MYRDLSVAVVIPAFNEEHAIQQVIAGVPDYVDFIVVVDDASLDDTADAAGTCSNARVEVVRHRENRGVGAAIVTGYERVLEHGADVAVVMAGDDQMDPLDLPKLLDPIADGLCDYSKGNRFSDPTVWRVMPATRLVGNIALSLATKVTSGYWRLFDSQCGYTAITRNALSKLHLSALFPRYGYPNDLLARLNGARLRVLDVPVRPVYGPSWKSGIRPSMVIYPISFVLVRSMVERLRLRSGSRLAN